MSLLTMLLSVPTSDPGEGIYQTSQQIGGIMEDAMSIVDWAKRDPIVALPSIFGPIGLLSWAFGRSRNESSGDWMTR